MAEKDLEIPENPFAEPEDGDEAEAEGAEEELEEALGEDAAPVKEEDDVPSRQTVALGTFKKRVGKLVAQRNTARDEAASLKERLARAEGTLGETKRVSDAVQAMYKGDMTQLKWDTDFLAELDTLSATDPAVAKAVNAAVAKMKETRPVLNNAAPAAPVASPEAAALSGAVAKLATKNVTTELAGLGVTDAFARKIASEVVATYEAEDLVDLDKAGVVKLTKTWLKENGFTHKDILKPADAEAKPVKKLAAGGTSGKAADGPKEKPAAPVKGAKAPSYAEARAGFESRRDAAFAEFTTQFDAER